VKKPLCMDNVSGFELQPIRSIDCNITIDLKWFKQLIKWLIKNDLKMIKAIQIMLNGKIKMVTNWFDQLSQEKMFYWISFSIFYISSS